MECSSEDLQDTDWLGILSGPLGSSPPVLPERQQKAPPGEELRLPVSKERHRILRKAGVTLFPAAAD